jgi:hypothetical protein
MACLAQAAASPRRISMAAGRGGHAGRVQKMCHDHKTVQTAQLDYWRAAYNFVRVYWAAQNKTCTC